MYIIKDERRELEHNTSPTSDTSLERRQHKFSLFQQEKISQLTTKEANLNHIQAC